VLRLRRKERRRWGELGHDFSFEVEKEVV